MKSVTVVLLTNGKPELLDGVLRSVREQEGTAVEVVVVLNGPNSAIEAVLVRFPGVRVIRNAENRGFTVGMNQGIAAATADYVYVTANDIELAPNYLAELIRAVDGVPGFGLVSGMWHDRHQNGRIVGAGGTMR